VSTKKTCFVISPIGEPGSPVRDRSDRILRDLISPAVEPFGYLALRADQTGRTCLITDYVIRHVTQDPLVIADLATNNLDVFYELGVREGARKPAILIKDAMQSIPFELGPWKAISVDLWDRASLEEARESLAEFVKEIEASACAEAVPVSDQTARRRDRTDDVAVRFGRLAQQWRAETSLASSVLEICTHPAYQRIIGMGRAAIALILRELQAAPDHWFWALKAITGEDPVPREHRGNVRAMTDAWLTWGAQNRL